jgi:hypothetical protein
MPSFGGDIGIRIEERGLDEELVGIPRCPMQTNPEQSIEAHQGA